MGGRTVSTTLTTVAAAGWYPDPAAGAAWRWWDGAGWTDHVRAADQTGPATVAATSGPERLAGFDPVPQPGQIAETPQAGGPIARAADIPASEQMYWHSASAEVIEVPRMPHHTISSEIRPSGPAPHYVRDWQDLGSPQTAGIWLLAAMPLLAGPISGALVIAAALTGLSPQIAVIAAIGVTLGLCWLFALLDARSLTARGYHAASLAWMLVLPPLLYIAARGRAVRREGRRAWPPELLFFPVVLAGVVSMVMSVLPLLATVTIG
ncbi:MAG TPA: DUF2510 domain-containing protein [Pseudolysinimonas sp.]|nr:DUF2510 domain-containing protein [Pseudolysinimonas sp.]